MASGIFGTGISGLQAAQRALNVASHNISNVNTEGYSRQRVSLDTREPQFLGGQYIGTGVTVSNIQRIYDEFNTLQLRTSTSGFSHAQQFHALSMQMNNLLANADVGVMPALQNFFDAVQGVANDPSSQVTRQVMLSEANNLAGQIRHFDQQLDAFDRSTGNALAAAVGEVNGLSSAIAGLNKRILDIGGSNGIPNDLLDKRDQLIRQMSELVSVTTVAQDDGTVNVFIGNGQAVVAGVDSRPIALVPNAYDPDRFEIAYNVSPSPIVITGQLSGGKIGGIVEFRNHLLEPARNALGQLAVGITATFNEQHAMGMDLSGQLGGNFFTPIDASTAPPTAKIMAGAKNSGLSTAAIEVVISDAAALTASDYRLERNGSVHTLTRLSDNRAFVLNGFPGSGQTVDGLTLTLASGMIADGDSFIIRPTYNAAKNFGVAISDSSKIAAAGPLRSSASLGNIGTGGLNGMALFDRDAYTGIGYTVTTSSGGGNGPADSYTIANANNVVVAAGTLVPGEEIEFDGIRFSFSGVPHHGDSFAIAPNINGVSDNRNALALGGLQTARIMNNGAASYESLYSQIVADIGNKTHQAGLNRDVQNGMLNRAIENREAISGVNLDEEAAMIMRHQQAYQAAAQLISTANSMFETLITMVRR